MQTVWSSIALACLVAGADAFGVMPEPGHPESGHPTCEHGHTGDSAMLGTIGGGCAYMGSSSMIGMIGGGSNEYDHDETTFECKQPDGSDTILNTGVPGLDIDLKHACPAKCGNPCGHAPTEDNDAVAGRFTATAGLNCKALADAGFCASEMAVNWFCGESCRGGAPWDECMWVKTAQEQIEADCADPAWLFTKGYLDVDACVDDSMANWLWDPSMEGCPGNMDNGDGCYYDTYHDLVNLGSTEVHKCPGVHRRKLTRSGPHSDAMKTKGEFALTASGSK